MLKEGQKKQNDLELIGMTLIINHNSNPRIQFPITENVRSNASFTDIVQLSLIS